MSLIKQLWLAIILVITLSFGASCVTNIISNKHYLEQQLEIKNTDNAVSLALSMSQMKKDPVALNLMLSAQFDNGHYQYIRFTDPRGKLINEKINSVSSADVPSWFKSLIPIQPAEGIAQVQDGWTQYGTLRLATMTDFAYQSLWQGSLTMLLWSAIIALACGILGSFILKLILKPLNEMVEMTEKISDKNFVTISEPSTHEFKALAKGMNLLSKRIESMLHDQSRLLDQMRIEANYDPITGLSNRKYFSSLVSSTIMNNDDFNEGLLVISHINNLAEINQSLGNVDTDAILKRMGMALQAFCDQYPSLIAGRLTGADFAVFSAEPVDSNILCGQVKNLLHDASGLSHQFENFALPTVSSKVHKSDRLEGLKKLIDAIKVHTDPSEKDIMELIDHEDIRKYEDTTETEWRSMLTSALEAKRLKLASFPVVNRAEQILHHESPARLQLTEGGSWHAAGEFIAWATQLGLVSQLDRLVVEVAIKSLNKGAAPIGLNVSTSAMCNPDYLGYIEKMLKRYPEAASKLWLEVPEHGVFQNLPMFRDFCKLLKPLGCKIGVEHVGTHIGRLGELHDLAIDYIKIDVSIIRDIDKNPGNKALLKGICLMAHSIGVISIAEGVQTTTELATLRETDIDAMTGPAIN